MEFNEKLQNLRKQKGLTQEELATALFVSRTAISKWESGRGYPNIESTCMSITFLYIMGYIVVFYIILHVVVLSLPKNICLYC